MPDGVLTHCTTIHDSRASSGVFMLLFFSHLSKTAFCEEILPSAGLQTSAVERLICHGVSFSNLVAINEYFHCFLVPLKVIGQFLEYCLKTSLSLHPYPDGLHYSVIKKHITVVTERALLNSLYNNYIIPQ